MPYETEDFDNLRRLLLLKRHEQPPPGYFEELPREILARLEAGESTRTAGWEAVGWEAPWLHRLWESLAGKPLLTGAFGVTACAAVIAGALYAERLDLPALADNGLGSQTIGLKTGSTPPLFSEGLAQSQLDSATNSSVLPALPGGLFSPMFDTSLGPERVGGPFGSPRGN